MSERVVPIRSVVWFAAAAVVAAVLVLVATRAWSVDASSSGEDATYVPTPGCRLVDTRPAPNNVGPRDTPLGPGGIYEVAVHGSNGNCTGSLAVPSDAVAVALNVTAVNATAVSNIRLYPADLTSVPLVSNLNVTAGAPATPNKVDVRLSPDGRIRIFNEFGSVNVVADVVGYYTDASLQDLETRLAAAEAKIAALESTTAGNTAAIGDLADAQPFATAATAGDQRLLTPTPTSYLDLTITAPVGGHVTVNYSGVVDNVIDGGIVRCNVYRSTEVPTLINPTEPGASLWRRGGLGTLATVSGTNRFDVTPGETVTLSLACDEVGTSDAAIRGRAITAIFTPSS